MMEDTLQRASLPPHCIADIRRIVSRLKDNSHEVSQGHVLYDHSKLPKCIDQLTSSKASKTKKPIFLGSKFSIPADWADCNSSTRKERDVLLSVQNRLQNAPEAGDSKFLNKRAPLPLSAKEQDFIYRYAEYKHGANVHNQEKKHTNTFAYRAYTDAFVSFVGRPPSDAEIREADRLPFVRTGDGKVGVLQRPHSSAPHHHVTNADVKVVDCKMCVAPPHNAIKVSPSASPARSSTYNGGSARIRPTTTGEAAASSPNKTHVCKVCGSRLPPRLVKDLCPACDSS